MDKKTPPLETIRNRLGLSRYKMAQLLGITQSSYDYSEQKAQAVRFQTLVKIQQKSGISWEEFGKLIEGR